MLQSVTVTRETEFLDADDQRVQDFLAHRTKHAGVGQTLASLNAAQKIKNGQCPYCLEEGALAIDHLGKKSKTIECPVLYQLVHDGHIALNPIRFTNQM